MLEDVETELPEIKVDFLCFPIEKKGEIWYNHIINSADVGKYSSIISFGVWFNGNQL